MGKSTICSFSSAYYKNACATQPDQSEAKVASAETLSENTYWDEQEISWAGMVGTQGLDNVFTIPIVVGL